MVQFRLLGPVEVLALGQPVDSGHPRQRGVLAALLVDVGRLVSHETMIDRVWGDNPPPEARRVLQSHLSRVRRFLGEVTSGDGPPAAVLRRPGGYVLEVDSDRVDLHRFRRLVGQSRGSGPGRVQLLRTALDLWRGDPLGGVASDWAARTRQTWQRERIAAVEEWARAELELGNAEAVIGPLTGYLDDDPLLELVAALLIQALAMSGRPADALSRYAHTRNRLVTDLGLEPGRELRAAHQLVLRGDSSPPVADRGAPTTRVSTGDEPVVPSQLPPGTPDFVGRELELDALGSLFSQDVATGPVGVVVGPGGVGKTALAVHWARRAMDRFPDGIVFVNLHGYSTVAPVQPTIALGRLLRALGVRSERVPTDADECAAFYRSLVANRRMLILLDNAHRPEQVRPLLPGGPGCVTLITSRVRFAGLNAMNGARILSLVALPPADALTLLERSVPDQRIRREEAQAAELAALCGHLPLAVRIAAAQLVEHPGRLVAEQVAAMREGRLHALEVTGDEASSMRATIDISYLALSAAAARLFRALSLIAGADFRLPVVAAVSGQPQPAAQRLLDELAAAHLLTLSGDRAYAFHDLLRDYAAERFAQEDPPNEGVRIIGRLYDHYLNAADHAIRVFGPEPILPRPGRVGAQPAFQFADAAQALAWLDAEHANIAASIRGGVSTPWPQHLWCLVETMSMFLGPRGFAAEWHELIQVGLEVARAAGNRIAEASMLRFLSRWTATCGGDPVTAEQQVRTALALYGDDDAPAGRARAWQNLGMIQMIRGERLDAVACCHNAIADYRAGGDEPGEASVLGNLGALYQELGEPIKAEPILVRAVDISIRHGMVDNANATGTNLATVYLDLGRVRDAIGQFETSVTGSRRSGHLHNYTTALDGLVTALRMTGRSSEAADHATTLVAAADLMNTVGERTLAYTRRGETRTDLGDNCAALADLLFAADLARTGGDLLIEVDALVSLAEARLVADDQEAARRDGERALHLARSGRMARRAAQASMVLSVAALKLGRVDDAVQHARDALAALPHGNRYHEALAREILGAACAHATDAPAQAESAAELARACAIHQSLGTVGRAALVATGAPRTPAAASHTGGSTELQEF